MLHQARHPNDGCECATCRIRRERLARLEERAVGGAD